MSQKIQNTAYLLRDNGNRCSIHKIKEPKTFSNFVDKVIGNLSVSFPSPLGPRIHPEPDNPIKVLGNKGLLNISQNTIRTGSCSTIDVSFYTEESQRGETDRIFSSNHHFRNGKLVYTLTQEMIPECIDRDVEKLDHRLHAKGPRAICSTTKRKQRSCKSATLATDVYLAKDNGRERYLHTLCSENIQREVSPCCAKSSPERYFYNARTTYSHSKSPIKQRVVLRSSSEISSSSKETKIYSSPEKTVKHSFTDVMKYRRTSISPTKPKIKNDLFVIPRHNCSKVRPEKATFSTSEASQWNKVCRFIRSPRFKSYIEHQKVRPSLEKQHCHHISYRTSKTPNSESEHDHIKSSTYGSRMKNGVYEKSLSHHNHVMSYQKTSPRRTTCQGTKNRYPSHISEQIVYSTADISRNRPRRPRMHSKRMNESCDLEKYRIGKSQANHTRRSRCRDRFVDPTVIHGMPEDMPAGEPFGHAVASRKRIGDESETRTKSEKSSWSCQFSSTSDSESEKPLQKYSHERSKTFAKPKTSKEAKYYKNKQKMRRDHSSGENNDETKRFMNLNKSVHFKNSGRCQYYLSDETIKDGEETFENDGNTHVKNKTLNNCCRSNSSMKCYGKIHKRSKDYQEVTYAKDTIGNSIRIEDQKELDIMENLVNENALQEYRDNFADITRKSRTENIIKRKETIGNNKYNLDVSVERQHTCRIVKCRHQEKCEACRIERLLED